jgi:hypothetical protein
MRNVIILLLFAWLFPKVYAQSEFKIANNKSRIVIPFQLINNLVFIPLEVNGEKLTFLLDTGVKETILFSLNNGEEISINNVELIKLRGLGDNRVIEGYKSSNNAVQIKGFKDENHEIYIVLDQEFNFSSQIGIPVNGIIGYHFFRNNLIEINYSKKKIIIYNTKKKPKFLQKISKRNHKDSISIELSKPYIFSNIIQNDKKIVSKLLLDSGNSDALWLFNTVPLPEKTIDDFLGLGFSGNVYGKRGRITSIEFGKHLFKKPLVTFPDSTSTKNISFVENRVGSIGGEILSRFKIVFDYQNSALYTSPNTTVYEPFNFNMSGIQVEHSGLEWVDDSYQKNIGGVKISFDKTSYDVAGKENLQLKFKLKPTFRIAELRPNSEAEKAGLKKGDKILELNGRLSHDLNITKINQLLKSEEGKTIDLRIERNGVEIKVSIQLKKII